MKTFQQYIESDDYKGSHEAPDPHGGAPLHDVTANGIYPHDFYSHEGFRYYSDQGNRYDYAAHSTVTSYQNRPNRLVRVYRAIPKDTPNPHKINHGDWVAIHKGYAHDHGKSHLNNNYKVISKAVHARDIFTDGNSIHEWGYHPQPPVPLTPEQKARRQEKFKAWLAKYGKNE